MPMMYMDAIAATIKIMQAPDEIKIRSSYNLAAMSFTPTQIAAGNHHIPGIRYEPDFRQKIANSWPASIDDTAARKGLGWKHKFDLRSTTDMLEHLKEER
jgi:nucleoside-diphosphate-sugar epimerase